MAKTSAGVLVKAKDTGRIFLMLRCSRASNPLTWAMVSGGIEEGEDKLDGLKREVEEECSIDPNIIEYKFIEEITHEDDGDKFNYYEGLTDSEFIPTLCDENLDWGWFDKDDLPEPLYPNIQGKIDAI